ncbi:SUMF1/EgtB/PvdO family nonheme iron enzyme [Bacillus nakamurai]|uniref:Sulfatase-modifying factor enzyme-like domain-containing protein n=2 Tax=Bacillus nakamurai TaxID=1793963 RepID=A0A150F5I2_9BACI|nr:SUMF1/EgtB/PvdO family nonheme iron enzyme [Bacillus nakamurai]KXZ16564.1 hypothetical protein AXI58_19850 [Bacillus nakamurai]MED1227741.1 SUMF1/EgtB/PvdO family nonheme iron enzyme [Bacillus nakamurai]
MIKEKARRDLVHQICLGCMNTDVSSEEILEIQNIFNNISSFLTEEELDEILSGVIESDNAQLKIKIMEQLPQLKSTIEWLPQFLLLLIHDPDESVSITAMNIIQQLDIRGFEDSLLLEIEKIIGGRKNLIENAPIYNKRELTALLLGEKLYCFKKPNSRAITEEVEIGLSNMILIPEGKFIKGITEIVKNPIINTLEIAYPSNEMFLKEYYMDKYPVTNKEYDQFCEAIEENGHVWCHPDEDCNKSHRRATFYNEKADLIIQLPE